MSDTTIDAIEKIEALMAELNTNWTDVLNKRAEAEPPMWVPKGGDEYHVLYCDGVVGKWIFYDDEASHGFSCMGNAFRTREGALRWADCKRAITELARTPGRAVRELVGSGGVGRRLYGLFSDGTFTGYEPGLFGLLWNTKEAAESALHKVGIDRVKAAADTYQRRGML